MSIELPEAEILSKQMNKELQGKQIRSFSLKDYQRLQRIGMFNKEIKDFQQLIDAKIESVVSRGNVILVKLGNESNLILGLEYGGQIFYGRNKRDVPGKFHLRLDFTDNTVLTVRLSSMGVIQMMMDVDLEHSYVYRRDFNRDVPSPLDEDFTYERFSQQLAENNRMLKSVLVGKDAVVVGLSNGSFQDIIYKAKLSPKRQASNLKANEKRALYDALRLVLRQRIQLGGKEKFHDLYGNQGGYTPAMGPNMKEQSCPFCGSLVEKMSLGGGQVYYCPNCQV